MKAITRHGTGDVRVESVPGSAHQGDAEAVAGGVTVGASVASGWQAA